MEVNSVGIDLSLGRFLIQGMIQNLQRVSALNGFLDYLDEIPIDAVVLPGRNPSEKTAAQVNHLPEERLWQNRPHFFEK